MTETLPPSSSFVMPFGKHAGKPLKDIPSSYIDWILANAENLHDDTRLALAQEEAHRHGAQGQGIFRSKNSQAGPDKALLAELIQLGMLQKLTRIQSKTETEEVQAAAAWLRHISGLDPK